MDKIESSATESSTTLVRSDEDERAAEAHEIVSYFSLGTAGLSLIPIPLLDVALFGLAQLAMVRTLAKLYDIPFSRELGKSIIGSLVGGTLPLAAAVLVRAIPGVGSCVGRISFTLASAVSTYAVGRVFIQHFESGGTFLTLDPDQVRDYYAKQLAVGAEEIGKEYAGVMP